MSAAFWIVFWWGAFAGSHIVLSSLTVRARFIAKVGDKAFLGLYSLIAFATLISLVWVYLGNRHAGGLVWNLAAVPGVRPLGMLLAVLGTAMIVAGVLQPSPVLAGMKQAGGARGLTRITRHPLFMGISLWALSHLLLNGFLTDVLFFGGLLAFSLAGAAHQDARKRVIEQERLGQFFAESSFWPFGAVIAGRNRVIWRELPWVALAIGAGAAVGIYALHSWAFS